MAYPIVGANAHANLNPPLKNQNVAPNVDAFQESITNVKTVARFKAIVLTGAVVPVHRVLKVPHVNVLFHAATSAKMMV
jgi:hypothetical protein